MEKYMKIGEIAKKAGVTVRTLQYYDKEDLLSPSSESEGGFRLYSDKDLVKLLQILMMKELGFPLNQIKMRLSAMDTPQEVIKVITEQIAEIRGKIAMFTESVNAIEMLKEEIEQIETVDFMKYSAILINLRLKNKHYWMVKHFDDEMFHQIQERLGLEGAAAVIETTNRVNISIDELYRSGASPDTEEAQKLAKTQWDMMMEMTGGDLELLKRLNELAESRGKPTETEIFLHQALEIYLSGLEGTND